MEEMDIELDALEKQILKWMARVYQCQVAQLTGMYKYHGEFYTKEEVDTWDAPGRPEPYRAAEDLWVLHDDICHAYRRMAELERT